MHASSAFLGILICTAIAAKIVITEEKQLALIISLLNSFVMMIVSFSVRCWLVIARQCYSLLLVITKHQRSTAIIY